MTTIAISSPDPFMQHKYASVVFLAGSIEMGTAKEWQQEIISKIMGWETQSDIIILNPRRADWDSSWVQEKSNPQFSEQVNWELDGLKRADLIFFFFDPATMSPISLMELGYVGGTSARVVVCCPPGFYRKGNVDIFCQRMGIPVLENFDEAVGFLRACMTT